MSTFAVRSRPRCRSSRALAVLLVSLTCGFPTPPAASAATEPIDYFVDLRETASHLIAVKMTVPDSGSAVKIQFPAWDALYQIRDFVRHVENITAQCEGQPRDLVALDTNTWRTAGGPCGRLEVDYAVYANEEGPYSCALNEGHAFLNFAEVLFHLPAQRDRAVRLRFALPQGWRLATLLDGPDTAGTFQALNYDALADSPAEAGHFQEYSYRQGGAEYRVIVHADPSVYSPQKLVSSLQKITETETELMRDVPFSRYTFFLHFLGDGGGGMEHRNGTAISFPAGDLGSRWEGLESVAAHEFFHVWNVKRIRPQALEPLDYVHGNDTRDLWFCEGVTSTYQELVLLRAGLIKRQTFYEHLAEEIARLEERPARLFQSAEVSGLDAWLERYPDYYRPERSISYYNKGALLGFLLDLGMRNASANRRSLDDLMRRLNEDFARRGRFYAERDLREMAAEMAPPSEWVEAFFRDYVTGTREFDYRSYLGFAGLELTKEIEKQADLGFLAVRSFDGPIVVESVAAGSNAELAGLRRGDILLKINGAKLTVLPQDVVGLKPSRAIQLEVRRRSKHVTLRFDLGATTATRYAIREIPNASARELRVRRGWLNGLAD